MSDFSDHLASGQSVHQVVPVDTDGQSGFILTRTSGTIGFTLTDPAGKLIDPAYAAEHPQEVSYQEYTDPNSALFAAYSFNTTLPGEYTLKITAGDVGQEGADILASVLVESPRRLTVTTDSPLYSIGSTATISAALVNAAGGVEGATVQAQISPPRAPAAYLTLYDQGGGLYSTTYVIPDTPGYLRMRVVALGWDGGVEYARQYDDLIAVSPPTAQLTEQYMDSPADVDYRGKYESLNLAIGLNVVEPGDYTLSADLAGPNGEIVAHGSVDTTLQPGMMDFATIAFNGDTIGQSGIDGPYTLTNLTILDGQHGGLPAIWRAANLWQTAAYKASDFAATCYVLDLNAGPGGTLRADPLPDCNNGLQYTLDSLVTLTANPDPGYTFGGWGRDAAGAFDSITLTLDGDKVVVANFVAAVDNNSASRTNSAWKISGAILLCLGLVLWIVLAVVLLRPKPKGRRAQSRW